jgi:hypothetical protein
MGGLAVDSLRQEQNMPVVSRRQNAAMHAAAEGESTLGIPPSVGAEMVAGQQPGDVKALPERVPKRRNPGKTAKLMKRGIISDRAARKHLDVDAASR